MRTEVAIFTAEGPLPDWNGSEEEISRRSRQLEAIPRPVTAQEAQALAACFGPDDCYGVAWTLVHLIETSPGPLPAISRPGPDAGHWHHTLWARWGHSDDQSR
ncbi:hypothetical protein HD597_005384 [Nonomuraea thailandensis]|uniref:Uncharacterized protein n=1 Tax=Nonomuraea thailandensis TaxID=1188745 RepID=A0A9X2GFV7_9ACTN|nr:hypothetical protein [Nonomuraea thailandensis]MCP2358364.1 hypothetical protein [Nonomuraea thailandensis]